MIFLRIAHHESLHWNKSWFEHVPCTNAVNTVSRPLLAQVSVWKCILWLLTRVPQPFSEKKKIRHYHEADGRWYTPGLHYLRKYQLHELGCMVSDAWCQGYLQSIAHKMTCKTRQRDRMWGGLQESVYRKIKLPSFTNRVPTTLLTCCQSKEIFSAFMSAFFAALLIISTKRRTCLLRTPRHSTIPHKT